MKKKILVIMGTTRQNRASEGVTQWVMKNLPSTQNTEYELLDLRDWPLPFFDEALPPLASQGNYSNELAKKWGKKAQEASGFLIVTGEYNHSIPAVLKNALEWWHPAWVEKKPVAFVSYGAAGAGVRSVEHLRQVTVELKMVPLRDEVNIQNIWAAFNEDGSIKEASHVDQLHKTVAELDGWFNQLA